MKKIKYLGINIYGKRAVEIGKALCDGHCYIQIRNAAGNRLGQLEVVIDEDGQYNGLDNKWVNVAGIRPRDFNATLDKLHSLGFNGCWFFSSSFTDKDCFDETEYPVFCKI